MEPKFQSSFIPKKPIGSSGGTSSASIIRSTNIFSVMATVIFLATVGASVGLFVYKNILTDQITQADKDITANRAAFQPEKIQQLVDANARITASGSLLEKHVVVSNFRLRALGERMALNAPIQGSAADILKKAMINVDAALHWARRSAAARSCRRVAAPCC